jgi:hypothetical protein
MKYNIIDHQLKVPKVDEYAPYKKHHFRERGIALHAFFLLLRYFLLLHGNSYMYIPGRGCDTIRPLPAQRPLAPSLSLNFAAHTC